MKKIIVLIMTLCMGVCLVACGGSTDEKTVETGSSTDEKTVGTEALNNDTKTLVVYFSNTGNTENIATYISEGLDADIYEIEAEEPYTDADLDYDNDNSRSTVEMNDPSARPAISGSIDNIEQYDTIYIGYPIWWGEAPRIMDTFVESYDFADKTIIPFCTSGASEIGSTADTLEELAGSGNWLEGMRFSGSEASSEIMDWVNSL